MAFQIIIKKRFANKVKKVVTYFKKERSHNVASDFLLKIDRRFELLAWEPYIGALSPKVNDIRGLLIIRHNRLYYKINGNKVIILNMYDTRMNPKRNPYKKWLEIENPILIFVG